MRPSTRPELAPGTNAGAAFNDDDIYANKLPGRTGSGERQVYGGFAFDIPSGASVSGIEVRLLANDDTDGGCAIDVDAQDPRRGWSSSNG